MLSPPKKPRLILIVDDDVQIVGMLRSNLEQEGYRVDVATDGVMGKTKATTLKPDLIVTDVFMPGTDGLEMLEAIQRWPGMENVPVILISGRAHENYIPSARSHSHKYALLKKPLFLPELNKLIRDFLV